MGKGRRDVWMKKKLKKRRFERGLRADDIVANIREEENTNQKTLHNSSTFLHAGEGQN